MNEKIVVGKLIAYDNLDIYYPGISIDYKTKSGALIPLAVVERYPDGSYHIHAYADASRDEPTYTKQVINLLEIEEENEND